MNKHLPPLMMFVAGTFMFGFAAGAALSREYWIGLILLWTGSAFFVVGSVLLDRADTSTKTIRTLRAERNAAISDIECIVTRCNAHSDCEQAISGMCHDYCSNYHVDSKGVPDCFEYHVDGWHCKNFDWEYKNDFV